MEKKRTLWPVSSDDVLDLARLDVEHRMTDVYGGMRCGQHGLPCPET
jgi:hypothetical protein